MTNEEAIIDIRENIQPIVGGKSLDIAISALEKQIPKKPILNTIFPNGIKWWCCPICRQNNIKTNEGFCHNCGQKLLWESDTE